MTTDHTNQSCCIACEDIDRFGVSHCENTECSCHHPTTTTNELKKHLVEIATDPETIRRAAVEGAADQNKMLAAANELKGCTDSPCHHCPYFNNDCAPCHSDSAANLEQGTRSGTKTPTTEDNWEERFERESPLAFSGRKWAKDFITTLINTERENILKELLLQIPEEDTLPANTPEHKTFQEGANWALTHTRHAIIRSLQQHKKE